MRCPPQTSVGDVTMTTNLKNLVHKTASVNSVKLLTPADRIGLGRTVVVMYPADLLSPGQIPLPHNPASEHGAGPWQEPSVPLMQEQMRAMTNAAAPASSAGCSPGLSATASVDSFIGLPSAGWPTASKRLAQAAVPAKCWHPDRPESDCQSLGHTDDRRLVRASRDSRETRQARIAARARTAAGM